MEQDTCRVVPKFQALEAPSQNFRAVRHRADALKAEEGEGEISRRHSKNGNPGALPKMCLGGVCKLSLGLSQDTPKVQLLQWKNIPFSWVMGHRAALGAVPQELVTLMPLKSHSPLPLDTVMPFHVFRWALTAVRRPTVWSAHFFKG